MDERRARQPVAPTRGAPGPPSSRLRSESRSRRYDELAGLAHGRRGELSARLEEMGLGVGQRVQTEAAILAVLRSELRGEPDD